MATITRVKIGFLWCSVLIILVLSLPRIGGSDQLWLNGLYDSLCVVIVFPVIVYLGASSDIQDGIPASICNFLGGISYPLYIIHYPFIYLFMAWVSSNPEQLTGGTGISVTLVLVAFGVLVVTVALAWACLKWYDEPVRKWLTKRLLSIKNRQDLPKI